ncbi:MAG: type II toxin-antitoxin system PemK/MazF family toxin [Propionibacteriaceae bacterium]|jgi:hypothetical protein|nr:type II toxin-antitoxin system PemK/MazF family toxin [Propionibacteriaceae bacterium]
MNKTTSRLLGAVASGAAKAARTLLRRRSPITASASAGSTTAAPSARSGELTGAPTITYAPKTGSKPDPGEVVWAWVPYEEDASQGKVRPVLLIGREGEDFAGVMFSSVNHHQDAAQEASEGRYWVKVGKGAWDSKGRASYARVDRVLRIDPETIDGRAEKLDKSRFTKVTDAVLKHC